MCAKQDLNVGMGKLHVKEWVKIGQFRRKIHEHFAVVVAVVVLDAVLVVVLVFFHVHFLAHIFGKKLF